MEKHIFYRAAEAKPVISKEQTAIPLEDKDFMIKQMLDKILNELRREHG